MLEYLQIETPADVAEFWGCTKTSNAFIFSFCFCFARSLIVGVNGHTLMDHEQQKETVSF
jgi:hypothetical protein